MLLASLTFTALILPLASYHIHPQEPHNQFNPGIAVEADWLSGGIYVNSFEKVTVFTQASLFTPWRSIPLIGPVRTGVSLGLGTGYRYPVIGGFQLQGEYWNITLVPKAPWDSYSSTTLGFSIRIPVKDLQ